MCTKTVWVIENLTGNNFRTITNKYVDQLKKDIILQREQVLKEQIFVEKEMLQKRQISCFN